MLLRSTIADSCKQVSCRLLEQLRIKDGIISFYICEVYSVEIQDNYAMIQSQSVDELHTNSQLENVMSERLDETKVSTSNKLSSGKHPCAITIKWDGLTDREMQELAQRTIIIAWQQRLRQSDVAPPSELTLNASDYKLGVRHSRQEVSPVKLVENLTPAQLEHFARLIAEKLGK